MCKTCARDRFDTLKGVFKFRDAFKNWCCQFDIYYDDLIVDQSLEKIEQGKDDFLSIYLKRINLRPYSSRTFVDSSFKDASKKDDKRKLIAGDDEKLSLLENKWGVGFAPHELLKLESLSEEMSIANPRMIETPQDKEYLRKICLSSLMYDKALIDGDSAAITSFGNQFSKLMQDSKLRQTDKTEADRTNGLHSFSEIFEEVENDDFIPPWAQCEIVKGANQDIVDKTIMHIENHTRRFNKEETLISPPNDTPKIKKEELDPDVKSHRDFFKNVGED